MVEQLSPPLSTPVRRIVTDAASLAAALHEHEWRTILCCESNMPHSFLDSLPGMACQIWLDRQGALHFPYVSEGCVDLLDITPPELQQRPQLLLDRLHPDDAEDFHQRMRLSAVNAAPWDWQGRIVLPARQEIKWVNLRARHRKNHSRGTTWEGFMLDITRNKQAEIEIEQSRQRLHELSLHVESIKEEERTRIAREIHDEIGALLTALKMDLTWLTRRLPAGNRALQEKTREMAGLLDAAGCAANNLVHSLRPGYLDCFGLVAAIEIQAREFTKRTGIPCKISKAGDIAEVTGEQSTALFRVFQEALNNIMKHAAARQVQVQIRQDAEQLELTVSDDGRGFDETARSKPRSFGLRGIQERIGQLGGEVKITSAPGAGTKIAVRLPAKN